MSPNYSVIVSCPCAVTARVSLALRAMLYSAIFARQVLCPQNEENLETVRGIFFSQRTMLSCPPTIARTSELETLAARLAHVETYLKTLPPNFALFRPHVPIAASPRTPAEGTPQENSSRPEKEAEDGYSDVRNYSLNSRTFRYEADSSRICRPKMQLSLSRTVSSMVVSLSIMPQNPLIQQLPSLHPRPLRILLDHSWHTLLHPILPALDHLNDSDRNSSSRQRSPASFLIYQHLPDSSLRLLFALTSISTSKRRLLPHTTPSEPRSIE